MNIRLRLTLWYAAILFLILAVFSLAVYIGLTRSLLLNTDNHLQREVGEMLGNMKVEQHGREDDEHSPETEIELKYTPEEGVYWRILDPTGRPVIDPGHFDSVTFDPAALQSGQTRFEYGQLANQTPVRIYTAPFVLEGQGGGIIQVAESYLHIQEVQGQLILLLALGIPFTLLAASAGGWFLAAGALNPIDRITRAAAEISAQDLHRRLNLKLPNDEVGRLAATFDTMLARLENAFERQKRFIADASHEMRTPLTVLKGDVEVALNRPRTAQEYRQTLEMVNQTADRLNQLVEELLLLARADNRQVPLKLEPVDLPELLSTVVGRLMPRAVGKGIAVNLDTPTGVTLHADAAKLTRLFTNLVENAIKYSETGDTVTVTVTPRPDFTTVAVADTGPGIAPEHMAQLFERFYRVDKARSRAAVDGNSGGAGLGLSIAQWLAQVHGGQITVSSRPGHGATFTVRLPLNQPEEGNITP